VNSGLNPKGKLSISDTTLCSPNEINISVADTGAYSSGYPAGTTVEWLGYGISGQVATTTISSKLRIYLPSANNTWWFQVV